MINGVSPAWASFKMIEDFSRYEVGKFPTGFRTYPFQRSKAMRVYRVLKEDGDHFLEGKDEGGLSVQVFRRFPWNLPSRPILSWKWRAHVLPQRAAENNPEANDSACGVYVVFGGYRGRALKYVWSSTLPRGQMIEKNPNQFFFIVLESGPQKVGSWQKVRVNIWDDYQKAFLKKPSQNPDGFGILTDGNATKSLAVCDYDDFQVEAGDSP